MPKNVSAVVMPTRSANVVELEFSADEDRANVQEKRRGATDDALCQSLG